VAALFLILVIAGVVAAMARLAATQHSTSSLALQQARAYQAARAGLEWGIARALNRQDCKTVEPVTASGLEGYRVSVYCGDPNPVPDAGTELLGLTATAEYSQPGSPDYIQRKLETVVEREKQP